MGLAVERQTGTTRQLMKRRFTMGRFIYASLLMVVLLTSAACNTISGFGRDVERVGEETQDAANSVRRKL